ncbi:MAG: hypothetical protein A4E69_02809 [Syntrophus sp. PtaB.Bin138]|nr:MAG: hypothetical protein A4E69_02809 [Syntrophus sp. PtaB.Bin138]
MKSLQFQVLTKMNLSFVHPETMDVTLFGFQFGNEEFFGLERNFCMQKLTAQITRKVRPG